MKSIVFSHSYLLRKLSFSTSRFFLLPPSADPRGAQPPPYMVVSPEAMASSICCGQIQCTSASPAPRPTIIPLHSFGSFLHLHPRCGKNNLHIADYSSKLVAGDPSNNSNIATLQNFPQSRVLFDFLKRSSTNKGLIKHQQRADEQSEL